MDKEHIINYDSQGWPLRELSIREILESWGITISKDSLEGFCSALIPKNILNIYPRTLIDDGMGYGIDEKKIINSDINPEFKYCNLFIEPILDNLDLWKNCSFYPGASVHIKDKSKEEDEFFIVRDIKLEDTILYLQIDHYSFKDNKSKSLSSEWYNINRVSW